MDLIDFISEKSPHFLKFRRYDELYENLRIADLKDISKLTGCLKPCQYKKYTFVGEREPTMLKSGNNVARVAKCQFFYTNQNLQTKVYPQNANCDKFGIYWASLHTNLSNRFPQPPKYFTRISPSYP